MPSILRRSSELNPWGFNETSQHGRTLRDSAGGGVGSGPSPPPGRRGVSASGSEGCSLALVPAAGGRAVCLLLRRRHIVCVRRGESGRRRCRFHPSFEENRSETRSYSPAASQHSDYQLSRYQVQLCPPTCLTCRDPCQAEPEFTQMLIHTDPESTGITSHMWWNGEIKMTTSWLEN